MIFIYK